MLLRLDNVGISRVHPPLVDENPEDHGNTETKWCLRHLVIHTSRGKHGRQRSSSEKAMQFGIPRLSR